MKIAAFKTKLSTIPSVQFVLPNGQYVPAHFHITEVGLNTKHFIDCGGTIRNEKSIIFQLWEANDYDHRLAPQKLLSIIDVSQQIIGEEDLDIEVEYQDTTIGKYGLDFNGKDFVLTVKQTNCLAKDKCGIPEIKPKVLLSESVNIKQSCCTPGGGCC